MYGIKDESDDMDWSERVSGVFMTLESSPIGILEWSLVLWLRLTQGCLSFTSIARSVRMKSPGEGEGPWSSSSVDP